MKTILLATSEKKILPPITDQVPSPLLPLGNRPIMEHAIEMLARQSVKQIIVSLNHFAGNIESYFGSGQRWGVTLQYTLQRDDWGTAGALAWAQNSLQETFLVLPADRLIDFDIHAALQQHESSHSLLTAITSPKGYPGSQTVTFHEDEATTHTLTGAYLCDPEILRLIPARTPYDLATQLIPRLIEKRSLVSVYEICEYWNPLDSSSAYQEGQSAILHSQFASNEASQQVGALKHYRLEGRQIQPGIWVGKNVNLHPSIRLTAPVHIGDNAQIGAHTEIGPETVIGEDVIVDEGATIQKSTILNHTYIGKMVNIQNRIVYQNTMIDVATGTHTQVVDPFLLNALEHPLKEDWFGSAAEKNFSLLVILLSLPITFPLAALLLITTGKVFEKQPFVSREQTSRKNKRKESYLLRFAYFRRDGKTPNPLSRWLKRNGFLHLPAILNVLQGKLKLIGAHPLPPEQTIGMEESWQQQLFEIPAGFLGLWYVQCNVNSDPLEIQVMDVYYAATHTWKTDLAILGQSPSAWLRRRQEMQRAPQYVAQNQVMNEQSF